MHARLQHIRAPRSRWLVALTLLLAVGTARRAYAEPPPAESAEAPTVIIASLLDEGDDVRAQVQARLLEDLEGRDTTTPDGQPLIIDITEAREAGSTVRVGFRMGTKEVYVWTCACGAMELQQQLPGATLEALRLARVLSRQAVVEAPAVAPPEPTVAEPEPTASRSPDRAHRWWTMHVVGIGITGLGVAPLAAGSAALITRAAAKGDLPTWAIASAATGAVLVSVGVPLTVIGYRRDRRSSITLRLVPTGSGLAVHGRF
jgi:hypothetical protein